jgi:prepilin-type N-terminal cleavage/methylation domain-containing protein
MKDCIFVSIRNEYRKTLIPLTRIRIKRLCNKAGFSLLEFTLVLIIISALAAILIPKFNRLQDDAHQSSVQLTANSLQSAVRLTHSLWQSQGSNKKTGLLTGYGSGNILMGIKGWPIDAIEVGRKDSTIKTVRFVLDNSTCERLWNGLLKDTAPKVGLENIQSVLSIENDNVEKIYIDSIYLAQAMSGTCRYRYRLNKDDLRISYDLATGRVITLF